MKIIRSLEVSASLIMITRTARFSRSLAPGSDKTLKRFTLQRRALINALAFPIIKAETRARGNGIREAIIDTAAGKD